MIPMQCGSDSPTTTNTRIGKSWHILCCTPSEEESEDSDTNDMLPTAVRISTLRLECILWLETSHRHAQFNHSHQLTAGIRGCALAGPNLLMCSEGRIFVFFLPNGLHQSTYLVILVELNEIFGYNPEHLFKLTCWNQHSSRSLAPLAWGH